MTTAQPQPRPAARRQPRAAAPRVAPLGVDPCDVLGIGDDVVSFAVALRAYAARYEQQVGVLLGVGADLLAAELGEHGRADPQALRQALTPRIRPLLEAAAALEALAAQTALASGDLPAGEPGGEGALPQALLAPEPDAPWPPVPGEHQARLALASWARRALLVPDALFDGDLEVQDASVARLTVTRVLQQVTETRMWTAGMPPALPEYEDDAAAAAGTHRGFEAHRWEGIRAGSVNKRSCSTCGGDGRLRCSVCSGSMFERCPPFEACRICRGSGRQHRRSTLRRAPCDVCNARGVVPCPACGGMGRRLCSACTDGNTGCQRCRGYGRVTEYVLAVVERTVTSEVVPVGDEAPFRDGAEPGYRRLATLTGYRPLEGMPAPVDAALREVLGAAVPGQLRQKVEVEALLALRVGYRRGSAS